MDTTGARDAFLSGLVVGLRTGWGPGKADQLAPQCAATAFQHLGGKPRLSGIRLDRE